MKKINLRILLFIGSIENDGHRNEIITWDQTIQNTTSCSRSKIKIFGTQLTM